MSRYEIDHEAADERETNLVAEHVASLTEAVKAGEPEALAVIDEAMQDWTPADWNALTIQSAAGVNHMAAFIAKTIQAEAEKRAAAEVVDEIRNRPVRRFFGSAITRRRAAEAWDQFQAGHLEFS